MIQISHSAAETKKIAAEFARRLEGGEWVGLYGDLGSGKTTFVQGMARGLRIKQTVTSPSFTLINEYPPLVHVDLYRLEGKEVVLPLEDYPKEWIVVIEWAGLFSKKVDFQVRLENKGGKERRIEVL